MKVITAIRDVLYEDGSWRDGSGRKPKELDVIHYAGNHPEASVTEIAKALGVSRTTVYKYVNQKKVEKKVDEKKVDVVKEAAVDYVVNVGGSDILIDTKSNEKAMQERQKRLMSYYEKMKEKKS